MEDLEAVRDLDPGEVQRRFRVMEDDRKAYLEVSNNAIRLQRQVKSVTFLGSLSFEVQVFNHGLANLYPEVDNIMSVPRVGVPLF